MSECFRPTTPGRASARTLPGDLLLLVFPALAFLLLWEVLIGGKVLLPALYLQGFSPWDAALTPEARQALPQWNALQWDGMAEFYPWRLFAAREMTAGRIPLWNPHVLCGTPFLANSQSAPLYPLHLVYYLPLGASVAARMGWLAALHLALAGTFAYLLARDLGARPAAAAVGGAAFELCGFAVAWLELPSFISVACWIPLVMLCLARAVRHRSWRWTAAAGASAGMMLLAGHLQIAFYGLLAAAAAWVYETTVLVLKTGIAEAHHGDTETRSRARSGGEEEWESGSSEQSPDNLRQEETPPRIGGPGGPNAEPPTPNAKRPTPNALLASLGIGAAFLVLALALAAPQLLPSVELSRMSHRVTTASWQGFQAYAAYAMPRQNWITLLVPDYFGLPGRNDCWQDWNYIAPNVMEYAGWVGPGAFVLVLVGLIWGRRITPRLWLLVGIAVLSLLLATGTPLAALFYFGVPGFAQSGSPARALVLFCLVQALLAALGAEWLCRRSDEGWLAPVRTLGWGVGGTVLLILAFHALAWIVVPRDEPAAVDANLRAISLPALGRGLGYAALSGGVIAMMAWLFRENRPEHRRGAIAGAALAAVGGGLLLLGSVYNLTAPPSLAYPPTALTAGLAGQDRRVATLNRGWGLGRDVPRAVLPPNASLAGNWRDTQGYDSLMLAVYRGLANALAPEGDAAPGANGNMVFIKAASSPLFPLLGAPYVVSRTPLQDPRLSPASGFPAGPPYVYAYRYALPEAFTVSSWTAVEDPQALDVLRGLGPASLSQRAVVASGSGQSGSPGSSPSGAMPSQVRREAPGRITVQAQAAVPSLLVLLESYAPGWKATVEGPGGSLQAAPVLRADIAFQGVPVPAGTSTVRWRYEPATFRAGLFLALAAITIFLATAISSIRER